MQLRTFKVSDNFVHIRGPNRLPGITLDDMRSGNCRDGILELVAAEEIPGKFDLWPAGLAYLKRGMLIGDPYMVADSQFRLIEESVTLHALPVEVFYGRTVERNNNAPIRQLPGWWACLAHWSHLVYFHWFAQCLASLELVERVPFQNEIRFIVPRLRTWQRQSLEFLNIPKDRIFEVSGGVYECEHLIYPTDLQNQPEVITPRMMSVCRKLRDNIVATREFELIPAPWLYLSRFDASSRLLQNEGALVDRLRQRGFTVVSTAAMDFAQEVLLFANAKLIVAAMGSGLTNIAFSRPGTVVFELNSMRADYHLYRHLGELCDLDYTALHFVAPGTNADGTTPWRIDDLDRVLVPLEALEAKVRNK